MYMHIYTIIYVKSNKQRVIWHNPRLNLLNPFTLPKTIHAYSQENTIWYESVVEIYLDMAYHEAHHLNRNLAICV